MNFTQASSALEHLQRFLLARGWRLVRSGRRLDEYAPPQHLQLPQDFSIGLPRTVDAPDVLRFLNSVADTLASLYDYSVEQVEPVLEHADTVFSIKIDDRTTIDGAMEFTRFEAMIEELRRLILDTATFLTEDDPVIERVSPEAETYLTRCKFLQTTRGSFVANVQLPADDIIRERSLLNPEPIRAHMISERLSNIFNFVITDVLGGASAIFSDEHIQTHPDLININILEDVSNLLYSVGDASLVLSFLTIERNKNISSGPLTFDKTAALDEYVKFVRSRLIVDIPLQIEGRVVELRSRNPQGNRNYVLIQAQFDRRPTYFGVIVNNERYSIAVQAHRNNRAVRVIGRGRRMKTQIKITELSQFEAI